jgi:hypothetical protein
VGCDDGGLGEKARCRSDPDHGPGGAAALDARSSSGRDEVRAFLASEQRGHSHALAPLHRYSFQPTMSASLALPEREPPSNHALGALSRCAGLSHVSSSASRLAEMLNVLMPMRHSRAPLAFFCQLATAGGICHRIYRAIIPATSALALQGPWSPRPAIGTLLLRPA